MSLEPQMDALLAALFGSDILVIDAMEEALERMQGASFGHIELQQVHDFIAGQSVMLDGAPMPAVLELRSDNAQDSFGLMAQLHGNEPAGLAAVALVMFLWRKNLLRANVYCLIGTPLAAQQYFEAWARNPSEIQETRDAFRRGYAADGSLLRDPNRIPADFREKLDDPHNRRAVMMEKLAERFTVTLDIHSARGDLVCVTEYTDLRHLLYSPIRNVLAELAGNIGSHAAAVTFKTLLLKKPNIRALTGIEAGRHEDPHSPARAMAFTHAYLHNLGLTPVPPLARYRDAETGELNVFHVGAALNFSQLEKADNATNACDDTYHSAVACSYAEALQAKAEQLLLRHPDCSLELRATSDVAATEHAMVAYRVHQFGELEEIQAKQVVAVAVPSGAELRAPNGFYGLFVAKPSALYADKAAGVLPVADSALEQKFCYPCRLEKVKIAF